MITKHEKTGNNDLSPKKSDKQLSLAVDFALKLGGVLISNVKAENNDLLWRPD